MGAASCGHRGLFDFGYGGNKHIYEEDACCGEMLRSKSCASNTPLWGAEGGYRLVRQRTVMTNKDRGQGRPTCLIPGQALVCSMLPPALHVGVS